MHAAPGGQTGDNIDDSWGYPFLFESAESQELTVNIWRKIAARYRDEPTVIGYDLLNEPIAHYFDTVSLNPKLEPLYRKIVAGIREVDRNHIIFLGGAQWDTNFKVFGPPFDDKLAYTFHKYWMDVNQQAIQEYLDFRDKYNVPVWMGESGENTDEWIGSFRTLLERNNVGWCFWPYKKLGRDVVRRIDKLTRGMGHDRWVRGEPAHNVRGSEEKPASERKGTESAERLS